MFPILGFQDTITQWVCRRLGGTWIQGAASGIAIADESGRFLAAASFEQWNGFNIYVHIVIDDQAATLRLFELVGGYVFDQLRCSRLTLTAEASNLKAIKLHEKLGAVHEGTLVGAGRSGDDILISRLTPDSKIWRKLNERRSRRAGGVDGKQKQSSGFPGLRLADPDPGTI